MSKIKILKVVLILSIFAIFSSFTKAAADPKLIFAETVFRHGDRNPVKELKNYPIEWPGGFGELTNLGMRQEFLLGEKLKRRYINELHLLSHVYKNNSIYARSTDINRTIQSLQCVLYAMYPLGTGPKVKGQPVLPELYQPVPIRTVPVNEDKLLNDLQAEYKTAFNLFLKYFFNTEQWKCVLKDNKNYFEKCSNIFHEDITGFQSMFNIADNIKIRYDHKREMPVSRDFAKEMIDKESWFMGQAYSTRKPSCFLARTFLEQLKEDFRDVEQNSQEFNYKLYSAHDVTLLEIMSAIGAPLKLQPDYSSYLSFELYNINNSYFLKVIFNSDDVKLPIHSNNGYYKLSDFLKLINNAISEGTIA